MVLSAGPCNCCGEFGQVIFLTALIDGTVFLACSSCAAASNVSEYTDCWEADGRQAVKEFAPTGFRAATEAEVASAGYDLSRVRRVHDVELEMLGPG